MKLGGYHMASYVQLSGDATPAEKQQLYEC